MSVKTRVEIFITCASNNFLTCFLFSTFFSSFFSLNVTIFSLPIVKISIFLQNNLLYDTENQFNKCKLKFKIIIQIVICGWSINYYKMPFFISNSKNLWNRGVTKWLYEEKKIIINVIMIYYQYSFWIFPTYYNEHWALNMIYSFS